MNRFKLWPHGALVVAACALVTALGVYFWMKHEQTASAQELPFAARIQRVDGEVAFSDDRVNTDANQDWTAATANHSLKAIESTRVKTRAPRWPSTDAISRGSIRTLRLTVWRSEIDAPSSRCATGRRSSTSVICNRMRSSK